MAISKEKMLQLQNVQSLKKMSLKFRNPKFNILCKIAFIFLIKCQPFKSLEVNKAILEQEKVTE